MRVCRGLLCHVSISSSVRAVLQARTLEWVPCPLQGPSRPRGWTSASCNSCTADGLCTVEPPGKPISTAVAVFSELQWELIRKESDMTEWLSLWFEQITLSVLLGGLNEWLFNVLVWVIPNFESHEIEILFQKNLIFPKYVKIDKLHLWENRR